MKFISISRLLGRQGMIKNYLISKAKNRMREDDEFTGGCVTTNDDRYYYIDEREKSFIYNRRRFRELKV
jgi:hypothetical protein